ncbi:hypothetical protein GCM10022246_17520 [Pedobacter ginsengiterrae]|uniref:Uncharacterized protein n=1 Tax=Pedobacter ginsengiterrae TaxID=871696 RepID=A0ABP7PG12_9SPHI
MTPQKMVKILEKHGTILSEECAEKTLELIYRLSNLSVGETIRQLSNEKVIRPERKKYSRKINSE